MIGAAGGLKIKLKLEIIFKIRWREMGLGLGKRVWGAFLYQWGPGSECVEDQGGNAH